MDSLTRLTNTHTNTHTNAFTYSFAKATLKVIVAFFIFTTPAFACHIVFSNSKGYYYSIDTSDGGIREAGREIGFQFDALDDSYQTRINGLFYNGGCQVVSSEENGREIQLQTAILSQLEVTRKIYLPLDQNFMRVLTIIHNPTEADILVDMGMAGQINITNESLDDVTTILSSSGDAIADANDQWSVNFGGENTASNVPYVLNMWDGAGGADSIDTLDLATGTNFGDFQWQWNGINVAAGETVIYLNFSIMEQTPGDAESAALATSAGNNSAFKGMSLAELQQVANWNLTADSDADGMYDPWENSVGLTVGVDDSAGDFDGDGLTNLEEFQLGTDIAKPDTDQDGLSDGLEINVHGTDPLLSDTDGDSLYDGDEIIFYNSSPTMLDSDGDGMDDGFEVQNLLNPAIDDGAGDNDGDGLTNSEEFTLGTDINFNDSDGDGLLDGDEVNTHLTSPTSSDSDGDGIRDGDEVLVFLTDPNNGDHDGDGMGDGFERDHGLNPLVDDSAGDLDGDGLTNLEEFNLNSRPNNVDSDGDGLTDDVESSLGTQLNDVDSDNDGLLDGLEVNTYGSNPLSTDSDGDTMPDNWEVSNLLDPTIDDSAGDFDADGLTNLNEFNLSTNPADTDTDNDGLTDGDEVNNLGTMPLDNDTDNDGLQDGDEINNRGTDPLLTDSDGDTMPDGWEVSNSLNPAVNDAAGDADADGLENAQEFARRTNPNRQDSDNDGLTDGEEVNTLSTNPTREDTDFDGLTDFEEVRLYGTNPTTSDTDGDLISDGWEILHGLNPNDAADAAGDIDLDGLSNLGEFQSGSDPGIADSDSDGISDNDEVSLHGSDPARVDTDRDGISDFDEITVYLTDPTLRDTDGDSLSDNFEIAEGLDPNDPADALADFDGDGISNYDEIAFTGTYFRNSDSDGDGISDGDEYTLYALNPSTPDSDNDGISDGGEINTGISDNLISESPYAITNLQIVSDQPAIAQDGQGNSHIVWLGQGNRSFELYYKMLATDGSVLIDTTRLTPEDNRRARRPVVDVDSQGRVFIVWQDDRFDDIEIMMMRIDPSLDDQDGSPASPSVIKAVPDTLLSIDDGTRSRHPTMAVDGAGNVHVAWDEPAVDGIVYKKVDANGADLVSQQTLVTNLSGQPDVNLAVDSGNNVHITWGNERDYEFEEYAIYYTQLNGTDGSAIIAPTIVSSQNGAGDDTYRSRPNVMVDSSNIVYIVWGQQYSNWEGGSSGHDGTYMTKINPALHTNAGGIADPNVIKVLPDIRIAKSNSNTDLFMFNHSANFGSDGNIHIMWTYYYDDCVDWERFPITHAVVNTSGQVQSAETLTHNAFSTACVPVFGVAKNGDRLVWAETYTMLSGDFDDDDGMGSYTEIHSKLINDMAGVSLLSGNGPVSLSVDGGTITRFEIFSAVDLPSEAATNMPAVDFPFDVTRVVIDDVLPGGEVVVSITLPLFVQQGAQYHNWDLVNDWQVVNPGSNDGDNILTLTLVDGGVGDADGVINGQIVNLGAISANTSTSTFKSGSKKKSSGGGLMGPYTILCLLILILLNFNRSMRNYRIRRQSV